MSLDLVHTASLEAGLHVGDGLCGGGGVVNDLLGNAFEIDEESHDIFRNDGKTLYPNSGHAFFRDSGPSVYKPEASKDEWERVKKFFSRHLNQRSKADG